MSVRHPWTSAHYMGLTMLFGWEILQNGFNSEIPVQLAADGDWSSGGGMGGGHGRFLAYTESHPRVVKPKVKTRLWRYDSHFWFEDTLLTAFWEFFGGQMSLSLRPSLGMNSQPSNLSLNSKWGASIEIFRAYQISWYTGRHPSWGLCHKPLIKFWQNSKFYICRTVSGHTVFCHVDQLQSPLYNKSLTDYAAYFGIYSAHYSTVGSNIMLTTLN